MSVSVSIQRLARCKLPALKDSMGHAQYYAAIVLMVLLLCILWIHHAAPQERTISFSQDIDLVPSNMDPASRITVKLDVDKHGHDRGEIVTISFQTDHDCYLTLLDFGTSGTITQLWPNQFSGPDNFVRAHQRHMFPSTTDQFRFRVSGPAGVERIMALAAAQRNRLLKESDFSDYSKGFRSYTRKLKDLLAEVTQATATMNKERWGAATARVLIGKGTPGGNITSKNVHVLSVGAPTGRLKYCDADARRFAQMIRDHLKVPTENVKVLTRQLAMREGFVDGLNWLAMRSGPEDLVFVYFSGHGTQVPDRAPLDEPDGLDEAFVCYHDKGELSLNDPQLANVLLIDDEFDAICRRIPAQRRIIVVDSCHSGSINKDLSGRLVSKYLPLVRPSELKERAGHTPSQYRALSIDFAGAKDTLAAACEDAESSFEDKSRQGGLFTYWLLESVRNGARDLQQAFESAKSSVLDDASAAGVKQSPKLKDETGLSRDVTF